jgi:hypothetical protein
MTVRCFTPLVMAPEVAAGGRREDALVPGLHASPAT